MSAPAGFCGGNVGFAKYPVFSVNPIFCRDRPFLGRVTPPHSSLLLLLRSLAIFFAKLWWQTPHAVDTQQAENIQVKQKVQRSTASTFPPKILRSLYFTGKHQK
eukprot:g49819.t1